MLINIASYSKVEVNKPSGPCDPAGHSARMSVWCARIQVPTLSSHHPLRRRHRHRLFKLLTTAASPRNPAATPPPTASASASASSPTFQKLSPLQRDQISLYVGGLLDWNQRMNLTAVTRESEVLTRHVEDSLAIIPPLQRSYLSNCCGGAAAARSCDGIRIVDVGSGAGLPGVILAIACPSWKITLLESMNKRCLFLEHIVGLTGLSNVEILSKRAENAGQCVDFRERFDVAVARAVAEMRILVEYCLPLVRVGGLFVAAKGSDPQEEVKDADKAIRLMGASLLELCSVESHSPHGQRTAVICLKNHRTPKKYPRHPGTPSKTPL